MQLVCKKCPNVYRTDDCQWHCSCGAPLDIQFEPRFPLEQIRCRKPTMWRYREALPLKDTAAIVSFDEGFTPLIPVDIAGRAILVKQEQLFPTGSFKDRGASVLISQVRSMGIGEVVEDSSGNAGSAIAAYCAAAGIACHIFVPATTSPGKLAQIELYGAELNNIPGSREDTARAVLDAAQHHYYASHYWNPFFFHGTKTIAFEICEQLGWRSPDRVVLPVGNGSLLLGAYIGFSELQRAGVIHRVPRLTGVQAENCAPLYHDFKQNPNLPTQKTIAEGIAIATPLRGSDIIAAVRETGGDMMMVSEAEIRQWLKEMCARGHYIEPTSAVAIAGVSQYLRDQQPGPEEIIVTVFTGHGLKAGGKMLEI